MWSGLDAVVRVEWSGGYADYAVSGGEAVVTMPTGVSAVEIGVHAGRLTTTNGARLHILPSILDITAGMTEGSADWPEA